MRGLTHVLTCSEDAKTPFSLVILPDGGAILTTSRVIRRGDEPGLCGGLLLDLRARARPDSRIDIIVLLTNRTANPWAGTAMMTLEDLSLPIAIGRVEPGATRSDTVVFTLPPGQHELDGSLLIGP